MKINNCLFFLCLSFILFGCYNKSKETYFSIEKSLLINKFGNVESDYNLYKFQFYLSSVLVDSAYLDNYKINMDEKFVINYLEKIYSLRGYDDNLTMLNSIDKNNKDFTRENNILLLDLYDSISLLSLSPSFATQGWGSGCSGAENYLIKQSGDSIVILNVLHTGILRGVFVNEKSNICGLLFEEYTNGYNNYYSLNGNYRFIYKLNERGLECNSIENVRHGEPLDKNDSVKFKDFAITPQKLEKQHRLKVL